MKHIFLIIVAVLTLASCKKETTRIEVDIQVPEVEKDPIQYVFNFPDTVYINQSYNGTILYESILDTITTSFEDNLYHRYVIFCMKKTNTIDYTLKELKKMELDSTGADNHRQISLYNIKFTEKGVQYIDGIIVDEVIFDTPENTESTTKDSLFRYITNEVRAIHKVVVIEE